MGWSVKFRHYTFPILETLRPIPILAWVPLSILMFPGFEAPVIFLATLASLFVTTLNTMLGVQSIDESYFRAAGCLGSSRWQVFRHVVVPGALPFIFTGLQISIGVAWFSLVAAEMVSGDWGLGYLIVDAYMNNVTVPMVIGMVTLGFVGWGTSALVRLGGQPDDAVAHPRARAGGPLMSADARTGAISIRNVTKIYDPEGVNVLAVDDCSLEIGARRGLHDRGAVGVREDDAAECNRRLPLAHLRRDPARRRRAVQRAAAAREPGGGPGGGVPERRPVSVEDARRQRRLRADGPGDPVEGRGAGEGARHAGRGRARRRGRQVPRRGVLRHGAASGNCPGASSTTPKVLLLDEPYRAMDALTKSIMHETLLEMYDRTKVTIYFITHDLEEAIFLGDRVVVMTTRPCRVKTIVDVKIPRPRDYHLLSSEEFRVLVEEAKDAVPRGSAEGVRGRRARARLSSTA